MSKADKIFIQNMKDILENGVWDTNMTVRPRWEDGTPAHTIKKFGIVNKCYLPKYTKSTEISAGETPEMREA